MAIPCNACGAPVHEQIVKCPHCGDFTGVPIDPTAAAEVLAAASRPSDAEPTVVDSIADVVTSVVSNAMDALAPASHDDDLPRATARFKR